MDPKTLSELLKLPWATLVTLACGYMGYFIAHVGVREHHKAIDVTFSTLVFGFVAAFGYQLAWRQNAGMLVSGLAAAAVACLAGATWSRFGRPALNSAMRASRITLNDDDPAAWQSLFRYRGRTLQLTVALKDGTWLMTENLRDFEGAVDGPCKFGAAGDVLMYVTHVKGPADEDFEAVEGTRNPDWGDEITFIPKDQIVRVRIRRG